MRKGRSPWTGAIKEDFLEEGETAFEGRGREIALARDPPLGACLVPGGILSLDQGNLLFSLSPLEGFIANLSVQRQFFPTDEDETGAAKALMRLQDTYKLDPDTISKGELPGNSPLHAKPVQPVCLLWCMDKDGATADSWSLRSGSPRPLAVVLS